MRCGRPCGRVLNEGVKAFQPAEVLRGANARHRRLRQVLRQIRRRTGRLPNKLKPTKPVRPLPPQKPIPDLRRHDHQSVDMQTTTPRTTFKHQQVPQKPYRCPQPLDPFRGFGPQPRQPIHSNRHGTVTIGKRDTPHPASGESGHLSLKGNSRAPPRHFAFPASITPSTPNSRQ